MVPTDTEFILSVLVVQRIDSGIYFDIIDLIFYKPDTKIPRYTFRNVNFSIISIFVI